MSAQQLRGYVGWGDVDSFGVVLQRDTTYDVYIQPDDPTVDFDLYVYDENDLLVDSDESVEAEAGCRVRPKWTGPFNIFVRAVSGGGGYTITLSD